MYSGGFLFVCFASASGASSWPTTNSALQPSETQTPSVVVAPGLAEQAGRLAVRSREDDPFDVSAGQCLRSPGFEEQVMVTGVVGPRPAAACADALDARQKTRGRRCNDPPVAGIQ